VLHCIWANETWIGFLEEQTASYRYVVTSMSHTLLGERAWFQRIAGAEPDRQVWQTLTVEELRALQSRHEGELLVGRWIQALRRSPALGQPPIRCCSRLGDQWLRHLAANLQSQPSCVLKG
jgi:hypothetical protein